MKIEREMDTSGPEDNRPLVQEWGNRKERRRKAAEVRRLMKRVKRAWEASRR